jgi:hypothetical protein
MPYAIGTIVFGVDLTQHYMGPANPPEAVTATALKVHRVLQNELEEEEPFLNSVYPGDGLVYAGHDRGDQISEGDFSTGKELIAMLEDRPEDPPAYAKALAEFLARTDITITPELRVYLEQTEPYVFVAWGHS